ncbi:hypothetical protein [Marivita sp. GX14005]|uniref:hypothetical protein n=1 Tax=Marivita sp. GX14005 TaxID=2942276 RepID=UPI002019639F|nr:hypothetical protein [Marivita sp. GX14005]MCL3882900.1 hypothetical protein [Marivita sp. GX14005]
MASLPLLRCTEGGLRGAAWQLHGPAGRQGFAGGIGGKLRLVGAECHLVIAVLEGALALLLRAENIFGPVQVLPQLCANTHVAWFYAVHMPYILEHLLFEALIFGLFWVIFRRCQSKLRKSKGDGGGIRNVDYLSSRFDDDGR